MKKAAKPRQIHAPPLASEQGETVDRHEYDGPLPRPFKVWKEAAGWCSSCLVESDRPVVMFGGEKSFVGLCGDRLKRISDTMGGDGR